MTYSKELRDRVEQNLRMFDYPRFDDGDIEALLDEIDRLNAYALRLLSDETRTWHCEKCGNNWLSNSLVGKTYTVCPECESPMRPMSEIRQEEIAELERVIRGMFPLWIASMSYCEHGRKEDLLRMRNYYNGRENPLTSDEISLMFSLIEEK